MPRGAAVARGVWPLDRRTSGYEADRATETNRALALMALGPRPAVLRRGGLAQMTDDPKNLPLFSVPPVAKALSDEKVPAAEHAERHLLLDRTEGPGRRGSASREPDVRHTPVAMPSGQGPPDPRPVAHMPVERDDGVTEICRQAVERLGDLLPEAQLSCHLRVGDALRVIASEGDFRLIYEVRRDQGGICWRAAETHEPQLVEDVTRDPDYMTTDERVRSEVAVPVIGEHETLLVLDAEFPDRAFTPEEADAVLAEATRLEALLAA